MSNPNWGLEKGNQGDFESVTEGFCEAFTNGVGEALKTAREYGLPCTYTVHGKGTRIGKTCKFTIYPDGSMSGEEV